MKRIHLFTIYLLSLISLFALVGFDGNIYLPLISTQGVPGSAQEPELTPIPAETSTPEANTPAPTAMATDTPAPSATPMPTIDPNAICDCSGDLLNCSDFSTIDDAQACFGYCMETVGIDIHQLDQNNNNIVCENHFEVITPVPPTPTSAPTQTSTPMPTATPMPTPTVVAQGVCDCSGNTLNCGDFGTQSEAQACHDYCFEITGTDIHGLDNDGDGDACTSLPNWLSR